MDSTTNVHESTNDVADLNLEPLRRLGRDLRKSASLMSRDEVRFLVDSYYQLQEYRKATNNQILSLEKSQEPSSVIEWIKENTELIEDCIKGALSVYVKGNDLGQWCISQYGIGPVITAGLMAHIDIKKVNYVGQIWSFAGLCPNQEWKKGEKRPWNAKLKTLCWKVGQSFLKFHKQDKCYYGKLFMQRWQKEIEQNDNLLFAEQAKMKLEKFKIGKDTEAYKHYSIGRLPPAHILARACRWTVKIFLSHYFWVAYELDRGEQPPNPYVIEHLGHKTIIPPPGWKDN